MNSRSETPKPYNPLSDFLKARFGCKVFKVSVDAGFTCPNRDGTRGYGGCVYCESSTLAPKDFNGDFDVGKQLAAGMEKVGKRHNAQKFIAYFQVNTNTYAPVERLRRIYSEALRPEIVGIAVSTRPDCLGEDVLDLLCEFKKQRHLWIELGLQSANDSTLKLINRGHGALEFEDALRRAQERGIEVCAHVIIGLPGEGREDILKTVGFLASKKIWGVKFHQLQVIKGTGLERMYRNAEVKVLGLEEYSRLVVECLERLPRTTVIHRLCGDAPERYLVAPRWGANKFMVMDRITGLMAERRTFQGALAGC